MSETPWTHGPSPLHAENAALRARVAALERELEVKEDSPTTAWRQRAEVLERERTEWKARAEKRGVYCDMRDQEVARLERDGERLRVALRDLLFDTEAALEQNAPSVLAARAALADSRSAS